VSGASSFSPGEAPGLVAAVTALARDTGARILTLCDAGASVTLKKDRTPLTAADRLADRLITERLAALTPATPVISEEGIIPDYPARRAWTRFWLVDPLDGTKEFLSGNGEFTVNIGLVEDGRPVLGVIHAPALDLLYWAAEGLGAWRQEGHGPAERIFSRTRNGRPLTVVESRSHPSPELEAYLAGLPVGERIRMGSSLKFCLLAEGRADLYPRFGPTMEWDVAAGDCLYRNAGRTGPNPSPLTYGKPDLRNEGFVLGG
jgi:3'(2'), 5'-bisphosphate nucleotidase